MQCIVLLVTLIVKFVHNSIFGLYDAMLFYWYLRILSLDIFQVVSPELTFYDSTMHSLDHSLHGEKQLRAKLDLSIM